MEELYLEIRSTGCERTYTLEELFGAPYTVLKLELHGARWTPLPREDINPWASEKPMDGL